MNGIVCTNGEYMPLSQASVSLLYLGFIPADSTYDMCHVKDNRFFRVDCNPLIF